MQPTSLLSTIDALLSNGYVYIFLYIWVLCGVWVDLSNVSSRSKKSVFILSIIFLFTFIGIRWQTGTDWDSYKKLFDTLDLNWDSVVTTRHFDSGYVVLNLIVKSITDSYTVFLLVDSAVTGIILYYIIKRSSFYPSISVFLFYSNFMIAQFMGSNRRMIAMVLILWFFYFILNQAKIKSVVTLAISFLFHRSSIACVISFLIPKKIFNIKQTVLIISIGAMIGILGVRSSFFEMLNIFMQANYSDSSMAGSISAYTLHSEDHLVLYTSNPIVTTVLALGKRCVFLFFYIWIIVNSKKVIDKVTCFFYNINVVAISMYIAFIGSFFQMLSAYWAFAEIILIGRIFYYAPIRIKILFAVFMSFFGFFQLANALSVYLDLYIPYLPFWTTIHRL
ncbi:EpsG family protein [Duncaniella freteri]|uniref:EpsG family protein n=1 Tax=Duncaniella freteri TaxID=2530391 RepID=UPI003F673406